MTRLAALNAYWLRHPPAHLLVAGAVGYKPPAEALIAADRAGADAAMAMLRDLAGTEVKP